MAATIPQFFTTTHNTDGLPGYGAYDWFQPAGSSAALPVSGVVEQTRPYRALTTPGGAYGRTLYVRTDTGQRLFLTHFRDLFVRAGQRITAGMPLGTVHEYGNASHLHIGTQGAADVGGKVSLLSGASGPAQAGSAIGSADEFWYALETRLGVPHSRQTRQFLKAWADAEGTKARNNPLATTKQLPGSAAMTGNSAGVQEYPTPELGVQATAETIQNYPALLGVLKGKTSPFSAPVFGDLNKWSGQPEKGLSMTQYVRNIILGYQGNPGGKSAADIGSFDLGTAAGAVTDAAGNVLDGVLAVPRFLAKLVDPHNILRALQVLAGAVLVLVGVVLLARQVALANDLPDPLKAVPSPAPGAV